MDSVRALCEQGNPVLQVLKAVTPELCWSVGCKISAVPALVVAGLPDADDEIADGERCTKIGREKIFHAAVELSC